MKRKTIERRASDWAVEWRESLPSCPCATGCSTSRTSLVESTSATFDEN